MDNSVNRQDFFITSTDLQVGKTTACCALLQAINKEGYYANGYKPIRINYEGRQHHDTLFLQKYSVSAIYDPVILEHHQIWQQQSKTRIEALFYDLSERLYALQQLSDTVLIEGCGGWYSPITYQLNLIDWIKLQQFTIILVVGIQSGCINQTLLNIEAIMHHDFRIAGWIANRINPGKMYYNEIVKTLKEVLPVPLIGEIPYLFKPEQQSLLNYIDLAPLALTKNRGM